MGINTGWLICPNCGHESLETNGTTIFASYLGDPCMYCNTPIVRKGEEVTRIKTREEWEAALFWNGDDAVLTREEEKRNKDIQELAVDALVAASEGGDFSTPIYEIIEKYSERADWEKES